MNWREARAQVDAVRSQLGLEFGVPRLTFYVTWGALFAGASLAFLFSMLATLILFPYAGWSGTLEAPGLLSLVLFVLALVFMGFTFLLEFLHPIGRRQVALAKGLRKGTMKLAEPPKGGSS